MSSILSISIQLLLCLSLFTSVVSSNDGYCRTLVMSGGGNKGSYEAGVLYGLYHLLPHEDLAYDVVSGVSVGAINAVAVSLYPPDKGYEMVDWICGLWMNMTTE